MKCPFCNKDNGVALSSEPIQRDYRKESGGSIRQIEYGTRGFSLKKELCTNCGKVFQYMDDESLSRFNAEKEFFV